MRQFHIAAFVCSCLFRSGLHLICVVFNPFIIIIRKRTTIINEIEAVYPCTLLLHDQHCEHIVQDSKYLKV